MSKKIICLGIALVMCLGLLFGCGNSLDEYKATKLAELQAYADAKGEDNYSVEDWTIIVKAVTDGKRAIEVVQNESDVDTAVSKAKTAIKAVERSDANFKWTNDNAVYAFVKAGFESDILQDIKGAFETLNFQKVYVTEKNVNAWTPLVLLFVLGEGGISNQQEFIDLLSQDTRINHASKSRDLPFDTVDTRYIDKTKDTIVIGETLLLEAKGSIDYYLQPFDFKGLFIKPVANKSYTVADFPVDLKSVIASDNGWLYLELATEDYFNLVKATDILSRLSIIEKVKPDTSDLVSVIPSIWQVSDSLVADFASTASGGYPTAVIKGIKAGKVTVDFDGVICEITVV